MEPAGSHTPIGTGMPTTQMLNCLGRKVSAKLFNFFMAVALGTLRASEARIILSTSTYGEN